MTMRALLSILMLCGLGATTSRGEDVSVSANLSHRVAEIGSQVHLEVEIAGGSGNVNPPDVQVDGLDVRFAFPSSSQHIEIINGRMKAEKRTTLLYEIVPQREGDFTIPALQVPVDGKVYQTTPVGLKVQKQGAAPDGSAPLSASLEIEVKRTEVYVGEVVPVEVRLIADDRMQIREVPNAPELSGDGFTIQKFPGLKQSREVRNGREYTVVSFKTAMTPTKAGKLTIGPCEIPFIASVQRQRRAQPRSRSQIDSFFDGFFNAPTEMRRFSAKAAAVELNVKPLPVDGRPKDFAGAVGEFRMDGVGSPSTVKLGEPVTMRLTVAGEGNFDRVQAPVLVSEDGWKAYDTSEKFDPDNESKTGGTKTFEVPVIPEAKHREMPQFQFSYFDPKAEKYVTLKTKAQPLVVEGEPLVAPAPAPSMPTAATAAPAPDATPSPRNDISGIHYEEGARGTFAPIHTRALFWVANGLATLVAAGLLAGRWLQADPVKTRAGELRRERDELWSKVSGDGAEFYEHAARLLQVQAAIASGGEPASVDAALTKRIVQADEETAVVIEAIFDARAERLYAGGAVGTAVSSAERERVLRMLEKVCR